MWPVQRMCLIGPPLSNGKRGGSHHSECTCSSACAMVLRLGEVRGLKVPSGFSGTKIFRKYLNLQCRPCSLVTHVIC